MKKYKKTLIVISIIVALTILGFIIPVQSFVIGNGCGDSKYKDQKRYQLVTGANISELRSKALKQFELEHPKRDALGCSAYGNTKYSFYIL